MDLKRMDDISQYDDVLYSILKDCGNLPNFLDIIFGFLNRRTDLYHVTNDKNSPVGLPEGYAERFVKTAFYKWKYGGYSKCVNPSENSESDIISPSINEAQVEIITDTEFHNNISQDKKDYANEDNSIFTPSEYYNGAKFDHYSWSQTINDISVVVNVPENVTTKMLDVTITSQSISINRTDNGSVILKGDLRHKCKHLDVIWSLAGTKLDIQLEKTLEVWWDSLFSVEPKLDLQKIDCSRPFEDLSDTAQAKIEELQWNQERKRLGLPTSDDLVQEKIYNICKSQIMGAPDP